MIMKNYAYLLPFIYLLLGLYACQRNEEIEPDEYPLKLLLHQKRWQVIAMNAINADSST